MNEMSRGAQEYMLQMFIALLKKASFPVVDNVCIFFQGDRIIIGGDELVVPQVF